jgi:hypothetical protein
MKFKDYSKENVVQDRSQRKIDNKKAKRHCKNSIQKYDKQHQDSDDIYENFEKFNTRTK